MTIQEFLDNGNIIVPNIRKRKAQEQYFDNFENKPDTGDSYNVYLRNGMPVATNVDKKLLIKLVGKM